MTERMKLFLQKVNEDRTLLEKLKHQKKEGFMLVAKELGLELKDSDFPGTQERLTEEQLAGLNGGNVAYDSKDSRVTEEDDSRNEIMLIIPMI